MRRGLLDDDLVHHMKARNLPAPTAEFKFHPEHKWKFDWAYPDWKLAVEKEGIVYPKEKGDHRLSGRHVSFSGFKKDIEKYATAFALGWNVLRVLPAQIRSGQAAAWLADHIRLMQLRDAKRFRVARVVSIRGDFPAVLQIQDIEPTTEGVIVKVR